MGYLRTDLLDWDNGAEIYRDGWAALAEAKNVEHPEIYREVTPIHFYWREPEPFGRKQALPIRAALATQSFQYCPVHVWSNVDLSKNLDFSPFLPYVDLHLYDPAVEAVGTPLEGRRDVLFRDDRLCWLGGDLFRLLILYKYGGVYVDSDMVLLRSLGPLLAHQWVYQWGTELDKMNGAIMRLFRGSNLAEEMLRDLASFQAGEQGTGWGSDLYGRVRRNRRDFLVLPSAWVNTEWQTGGNMGESHHPFRKSEHSTELYDGAFSWHWHGKWDAPIEPGCKFEIIEQKIQGLYAANIGSYNVSKTDRHVGGNVGGCDSATFSPKLWKHLIEKLSIESMMDIGCGEGYAVGWFQANKVKALGFDGLLSNIRRCPPNCFHHDFTEMGVAGTPVDLIWCCEFLEHIESKYMLNVLATFLNAKYIAIVTPPPGKRGFHHVNCQTADFWIELISAIGFEYMEYDTIMARLMAEDGYFKEYGLLFRRVS